MVCGVGWGGGGGEPPSQPCVVPALEAAAASLWPALPVPHCRASPPPSPPSPPSLPPHIPSPPQACKYIEEHLAIPTESLGAQTLMSAAKTAMSSKIVGADPDFYARIVVDAVTSVKTSDDQGGCVHACCVLGVPGVLGGQAGRAAAPGRSGGRCVCRARRVASAGLLGSAATLLQPA